MIALRLCRLRQPLATRTSTLSGLASRVAPPSFAPSLTATMRLSADVIRRSLSVTFPGPRRLDDVIKKDMVQDKSGTEVADIWFTYHETKEDVLGIVLAGEEGKSVISRATKCPFFVQPVFRDDGYFMLVSQFQEPSHFLMAYLEDYKMDPNSATPLLTFSVFDDYAEDKDLTLVRCDILNKNIQSHEGRKVVQSVLDSYRQEDDFFAVRTFNETPGSFDIDEYVSRMNEKWNVDPPSVSSQKSE